MVSPERRNTKDKIQNKECKIDKKLCQSFTTLAKFFYVFIF
ncbi:hypothetical protein HMPREF9074_08930 [Capnocytophaga sp. oral taxon 329 str. F0087]|nr:hypothetical protein HMPREF9074_08930 [Capnocytophaga sp. oral taxon 329 str. F0087]